MIAVMQPLAQRWRQTLGMNERTLYIERENHPRAIALVNNKYATKTALMPAGVPVVPTLAVIRDRCDLHQFDWNALPDAWALKPNRGSQGAGILLAKTRDGENWRTASGRLLDRATIRQHIESILDGTHSLEGMTQDWVLFEPLIVPHPTLGNLVPHGLADIRVICYRAQPVLAMTRLPTHASEGRANLHQGAIGAGIDLATGSITRAMLKRELITSHPDTGQPLLGRTIPFWQDILAASVRCSAATGLGYLGADIVIDAGRGPLVIELNARPGLEIQNVTGIGLSEVLARCDTQTSERREHRLFA